MSDTCSAAARIMSSADTHWLLIPAGDSPPVAASDSMLALVGADRVPALSACFPGVAEQAIRHHADDVCHGSAPTHVIQDDLPLLPRNGRPKRATVLLLPAEHAGHRAALLLVDTNRGAPPGDLSPEAGVMLALGEFTAGLAHDLGNMLTVILGNAELIQHACTAKAPDAATLDACRTSAERIMGMTDDAAATIQSLLRATHAEDGHAGAAVQTMLRGLMPMLTHALPSSIRLQVDTPSMAQRVQMRRSNLLNALLNLCANARDAMPDGGTLRIGASRSGGRPARNDVCITVADTGAGIAPDIQDQVLRPYFTTKGSDRGTGLGLANIARAVRESGGYLRIRSWPGASAAAGPGWGGGTTVDVWLPCAFSGAQRPVPISAGRRTAADSGVPVPH